MSEPELMIRLRDEAGERWEPVEVAWVAVLETFDPAGLHRVHSFRPSGKIRLGLVMSDNFFGRHKERYEHKLKEEEDRRWRDD